MKNLLKNLTNNRDRYTIDDEAIYMLSRAWQLHS